MIFIGKVLHHLENCASTNEELSAMLKAEILPEGTIVNTFEQTAGRGQQGNTWESEAGKNISFSLLLQPRFIKAHQQFQLNMVISLALQQTLAKISGLDVQIKWPNDIVVGQQKIGGVLIQNSIGQSDIQQSIVGIGININQLDFGALTKASSLQLLTGKTYDLWEVLKQLFHQIEQLYLQLKKSGSRAIEKAYLQKLYGYKTPILFKKENILFQGTILGVQPTGHLIVAMPNGQQELFAFKTIKFVDFI